MLWIARNPWLKNGLILLALGALGPQYHATAMEPISAKRTNTKEVMAMQLSSPAFLPGKPVPSRYTCDGENVSPPLQWTGIPKAAKSLALVCDDPDAPRGTWIHWIVVNLPVSASGLPENGPLPPGAREIVNSFGKKNYGGPCPPSGTHRYFFKLYALNLADVSQVTPENYINIISQHTIAQAELMGTYRRQ